MAADYVYRVVVNRRLKNRSYTDRANRAARDRARREVKRSGGDWKRIKEQRRESGKDWQAVARVFASRERLAVDYANGVPIGNQGREMQAQMVELGFDDPKDGWYHYGIGSAAHG